jgi:hypothetical protein
MISRRRFAPAALRPRSTYTHPAILVVDEVGYLTCGTDAANVLFHVVNDRHRKKRAMIFTTNKPLHQWGRVLHDEDLAHAIVDRVLERGRFLTLDGPSMRTKHLGIDDPTSEGSQTGVDQPATISGARISGIDAPEFPEPTPVLAAKAGGSYVLRLCSHSKELISSPQSLSRSVRNQVVHIAGEPTTLRSKR